MGTEDEHPIRPTQACVDLGRLTSNYQAIQQYVGAAKVMAVIKANAYGHGLVPVAHHLEALGVPYFGVAFPEEGIELRRAGITTPILVLGGIPDSQVSLLIKYDLTATASSVEKLQRLEAAAQAAGKRAIVHLKIDTGMGRIGVHYETAHTLFEAALACEHCEIEGVFTHLANGDAADLTHANEQFNYFCQALSFYEQRGLRPPPLRHVCNSGGILQLPHAHLDMVRAGIILFGVYPSDETQRTIPLQPALTWKSEAVYFKVLRPHHPIGYGSTWSSPDMTRIVTVPVGYGDGYFRMLSNRGQVLIHGKRYPIVGRVCMDQFMVNIGWDSAYNGDEVILIGEANGDKITIEDIADWAQTIPYEVLTNIGARVPRVYLNSAVV